MSKTGTGRLFSLLTILFSATGLYAQATTYVYQGRNFTTFTAEVNGAVEAPQAFATADAISGQITLSSPLPPNAPGIVNVANQIIAYSFTDGSGAIFEGPLPTSIFGGALTPVTSWNTANSTVTSFFAETNSLGQINGWALSLFACCVAPSPALFANVAFELSSCGADARGFDPNACFPSDGVFALQGGTGGVNEFLESSGIQGTWTTAPSALLSIFSGNNQTGDVNLSNGNAELPLPLVVATRDSNGHPIAGVPVSFAITGTPQKAGDFSLSNSSAVTTTNGTASTELTLGTVAGTYQVTASCASCLPLNVTFTENASCQTLFGGDALQFSIADSSTDDGKQTFPNTIMLATFTPGGSENTITLQAAKDACGFLGFNWQQHITQLPYPTNFTRFEDGMLKSDPAMTENSFCLQYGQLCFFEQTLVGPLGPAPLAPLNLPFLDPPLGGYTNSPKSQAANPFPFYLSALQAVTGSFTNGDGKILCTETDTKLCFLDIPKNLVLYPKLQNGCKPGALTKPLTDCFQPSAPSSQYTTDLVGVLACDNTGTTPCNTAGQMPGPVLRTWKWQSTFNGVNNGDVSCFPPLIPTCSGSATWDFSPPAPGTWAGNVTITEIDGVPQMPPSVTCTATPDTLWPPDGKSVAVTVSGTITPGTQVIPAGGTGYAVTDEYGQVQPSGAVTLDDGGTYSLSVPLIAARDGDDLDGRTYTITVVATDRIGNFGPCSAVVTVLHDQGN